MLRLREMRSALEKAKTQGVSMQRRLVLYWFSMALAILAAVLLVVSLTGVFSNTAQKFGQSLTIQKHNTASALAGQMDGIRCACKRSRWRCSKWVSEITTGIPDSSTRLA